MPFTTDRSSPSNPRPDGEQRSILVVDDDALLRRLVAMTLRDEGFDVVEAGDGATALALLQARPFSLMLLDGQMPELSGREVVQRVRSRPETATLPVILVTADDALVDRLSGLAAGADDYLAKPCSLEEVVARVRAQLRVQDAWRDTLAAHARQRSTLARALDAAGRQGTLDGTAAVLCNALAGQAGVRACVMLRVTADGLVVPMASSGAPLWGLVSGDPLAPSLRRYLVSRASTGPWIERGEATPGERPPALLGGGEVACAPFGDDGIVQGLLLLELSGDRRSPLAVRASALAGAIDFAAVVHGILRPRLLQHRQAESDRMQLRSVLRERAFRPHFQPIVDLSDGRIVGAEALTRFTDGSSPEVRFKEAAVLGLGIELEVATLRAAIREATALIPDDAWLSLNVSPALMLAEDDPLRPVLDLCDREVVLELSEQEAVVDYEAMRRAVGAAGDGIRLSIDDAGSGFASLRHILRLQPAFIKLDRSWVHGVDADPALQAMIAGLRHFAEQTGAALIAEGIERDAERETLIDLRVDLGQGYLLGRPAALSAA